MGLLALGASVTLLAGCAHHSNSNACGARSLKNFIGKPYNDDVVNQMAMRLFGKVDDEIFYRDGRELRIIIPGEDILANYNPRRLNLSLDDQRRIVSLACF